MSVQSPKVTQEMARSDHETHTTVTTSCDSEGQKRESNVDRIFDPGGGAANDDRKKRQRSAATSNPSPADLRLAPHTLVPLCLEPMQLDGTLGDAFLDEECGDLEPLISLELNHLSKLFVVDECAVTSEFLLERL